MTRFEFTQWCPCCEKPSTVALTRDQAQDMADRLQAQLAGMTEHRFPDCFTPKTQVLRGSN